MTKLNNKRDDFSFKIANFPFICINIFLAPAYGVFISQFIRYGRACRNYTDFLNRVRLPTGMFLEHGYVASRLKASLQKFHVRHHELVYPSAPWNWFVQGVIVFLSYFVYPGIEFYEQHEQNRILKVKTGRYALKQIRNVKEVLF